jgi:hypothetical protein
MIDTRELRAAALDATEFLRALAAGRGRALLHVLHHGLLTEDHRAALLDACLHDRSYDPQCEGGRAPWLMQMLSVVDATHRIRAAIVAAMSESSECWDLHQLSELCLAFAKEGSEEARAALYALPSRRPDPTGPWLAHDAILQLDGVAGFAHLARLAIARPETTREDLEDLVSQARDALGDACVEGPLRASVTADPSLASIHDLLTLPAPVMQTSDWRARLQSIPVEEVLDAIRGGKLAVALRAWGKHADEGALTQVANVLFATEDPSQLAKCLRVFGRRAFPVWDARLLDYAKHPSDDVRSAALRAVAMNVHPDVRALALSMLATRTDVSAAIALLESNYESGDAPVIEAALDLDADVDEAHAACCALVSVFERNSSAECLRAMEFVYERSPCSHCRASAVKLLVELEIAPTAMREECAYDAEDQIRDVAGAAFSRSRS